MGILQGTEILDSMNPEPHVALKKKEKHQLKRDAFLQSKLSLSLSMRPLISLAHLLSDKSSKRPNHRILNRTIGA